MEIKTQLEENKKDKNNKIIINEKNKSNATKNKMNL